MMYVLVAVAMLAIFFAALVLFLRGKLSAGSVATSNSGIGNDSGLMPGESVTTRVRRARKEE
ncbi:hypothetical protein DPX39_070039900 [Trypanosoma brucei equiperdum]|uniref:Uncharacterized protein n=1 Tax=Trypanosoma brucei equiperdum TaxID=630700 RepID=A0A3L6L483_9TRYP|nr:hypothetical protein DPX39_070039900 [Trypanosoma brucei equiperdum]